MHVVGIGPRSVMGYSIDKASEWSEPVILGTELSQGLGVYNTPGTKHRLKYYLVSISHLASSSVVPFQVGWIAAITAWFSYC